MASDEQQKRGSPANVVGLDAKAVCISDEQAWRRRRYPVEWKECCREIFIAYQEALSEQTGGKIGWGRIRNMIMRDFDVYDGKRLVEENTELRRQDLEHWVNNGKDLGDAKFKFVDRYLHKSIIDGLPEFSSAAQSVIKYRESLQCSALRTAFIGDWREHSSEIYEIADQFSEKFYICDEPYSEKENFRTALYFTDVMRNRYSVIGFYYYGHRRSAADIIEKSYQYFGYFIPLGFSVDEHSRKVVHGILKLFDRSLYKTQEVVSFNASQCYLLDEKFTVNTAPMTVTTNPFRRVQAGDPDEINIRDAMQVASLSMKPSAILDMKHFRPHKLSDEQRIQLNNLRDNYLLW